MCLNFRNYNHQYQQSFHLNLKWLTTIPALLFRLNTVNIIFAGFSVCCPSIIPIKLQNVLKLNFSIWAHPNRKTDKPHKNKFLSKSLQKQRKKMKMCNGKIKYSQFRMFLYFSVVIIRIKIVHNHIHGAHGLQTARTTTWKK